MAGGRTGDAVDFGGCCVGLNANKTRRRHIQHTVHYTELAHVPKSSSLLVLVISRPAHLY